MGARPHVRGPYRELSRKLETLYTVQVCWQFNTFSDKGVKGGRQRWSPRRQHEERRFLRHRSCQGHIQQAPGCHWGQGSLLFSLLFKNRNVSIRDSVQWASACLVTQGFRPQLWKAEIKTGVPIHSRAYKCRPSMALASVCLSFLSCKEEISTHPKDRREGRQKCIRHTSGIAQSSQENQSCWFLQGFPIFVATPSLGCFLALQV